MLDGWMGSYRGFFIDLVCNVCGVVGGMYETDTACCNEFKWDGYSTNGAMDTRVDNAVWFHGGYVVLLAVLFRYRVA
jgi:hypothetical protein